MKKKGRFDNMNMKKLLAMLLTFALALSFIPGVLAEGEAITVGDIVTFGHCEQDNDRDNGLEQIEWIVLEINESGHALLLSRHSLISLPYNGVYEETSWENCELRSWLNGTFLNGVFNEEERALVLTANVPATANDVWQTEAGNDTEDLVFLLSMDEVKYYFADNEARKSAVTVFGDADGVYTLNDAIEKAGSQEAALEQGNTKLEDLTTANGDLTCIWWLRTPGSGAECAVCVAFDGSVYEGGLDVTQEGIAVRPALWVDLGA